MTDKIHCGIGPIPKNHRLGTMQECLEKNQVRYYGIKKIDPKLLKSHLDDKKANKGKRGKKMVTLDDIRFGQVSLRGKIKRFTNEYNDETDKKKKAEIKKTILALQKELGELNEKAKEMEKIVKKTSREPSRQTSRKLSKKTPKKTSRKVSRKTSRKTNRKTSRK